MGDLSGTRVTMRGQNPATTTALIGTVMAMEGCEGDPQPPLSCLTLELSRTVSCCTRWTPLPRASFTCATAAPLACSCASRSLLRAPVWLLVLMRLLLLHQPLLPPLLPSQGLRLQPPSANARRQQLQVLVTWQLPSHAIAPLASQQLQELISRCCMVPAVILRIAAHLPAPVRFTVVSRLPVSL